MARKPAVAGTNQGKRERPRPADGPRHSSVADGPDRELARIRSRVRHLGLTIRSRAATRGSPQRVYSVLDRATGQVVCSGVADLVELKTRLWWILRQRRLGSDQGAAPDPAATLRCPSCGTPRDGFFRYCRSCGYDWEVGHPSTPPVAASPGPTYLVRPDDLGASVVPTLNARPAGIRLSVTPVARPVAPAEQAVGRAGAASAPATAPGAGRTLRDTRSDAGRIVLAMVLIGLLSGVAVAVIAGLLQR